MLFQITAGDFNEDVISTNDKDDDPKSEVSPMSRSTYSVKAKPSCLQKDYADLFLFGTQALKFYCFN